MKFTKDWLDIHLKTKKKESQIIDKLNSIGLEVEKVEPIKNELSDFIIAKIIKANKHPNADRLKLCEVEIDGNKSVNVVCGAPNAKEGLLTIYAPPGSVIPKSGMKLEVSKIRGETSYGMLCSEAELMLSDESEGIIELNSKLNSKIGKPYFNNSDKNNVIELSVTPNRPDCLGVRGIARDLAACDYGDLKDYKKIKFDKKIKHNLKVKIEKGESFKALDNNSYTLDENMCVIADDEGPLGLGGIIGGTRSGTEINSENILLESAYFDPELTRKTAKKLDINSDAKFRFERGIDPNSVQLGLEAAAELITSICGGEASKLDIQQNRKFKSLEFNFDPNLESKIKSNI